jgi:hypothetical protein
MSHLVVIELGYTWGRHGIAVVISKLIVVLMRHSRSVDVQTNCNW